MQRVMGFGREKIEWSVMITRYCPHPLGVGTKPRSNTTMEKIMKPKGKSKSTPPKDRWVRVHVENTPPEVRSVHVTVEMTPPSEKWMRVTCEVIPNK